VKHPAAAAAKRTPGTASRKLIIFHLQPDLDQAADGTFIAGQIQGG
jgi:hypothetical protein